MYFDHYLWIYIKMFMFRKHLWNINEITNYNNILYYIRNSRYGPTVINYSKFLKNTQLYEKYINNYKFIKIYESIYWNNINYTYIVINYLIEDKDSDYELLNLLI